MMWRSSISRPCVSFGRFRLHTLPKDVSEESFAKAFDAALVEQGWYSWWKGNSFFKNGASRSKVFSLLLPPPNVTGQLHLGHALTVTIQDALVRWHRMRGFDTVWVPGCDHAGIATQVVVEKWLQATKGLTRFQLGREEFVKQIWKWKEEKGSHIFQQLETLGASLDWDRQNFTLDPGHVKAVNEAFIRLFDEGLIYRGDFLVNWSSRLQSAISDIEIDHEEINGHTKVEIPGLKRPVDFGLMYQFAYKIHQAPTDQQEIVVCTTRPETLLGDVAIAVHPSDPRYSHLIGRHLIHPFRKEQQHDVALVPIVADDSVQMDFGTGAVKITPGHDHTDFNISRRHQLPIINVLDENGCINYAVIRQGNGNPPMHQCLNHSGRTFLGLHRFEARRVILDELKRLDLFRGQRDHNMTLPRCSRSGDVVEPMLRPQWFISIKQMAAKAREAIDSGRLQLSPDESVRIWSHWMAEEKDWCISRQLWWGHKIPVWHVDRDQEEASFWVAAASESEARAKAAAKLGAAEQHSGWTLTQDEDVLDTWFSSALLPFANFGWPDKTDDLKRYFPLSLMETGSDILFFWVARMVMLSLQLNQSLPFQRVFLHGIICDSRGRKMSKSLGNVIDPRHLIEGRPLDAMMKDLQDNPSISAGEKKKVAASLKKDYPGGLPRIGTDALRFGLCTYNVQSQAINLDLKVLKVAGAFCNKMWQATRFYYNYMDQLKQTDADLWVQLVAVSKEGTSSRILGLQNSVPGCDREHLRLEDLWILSQCAHVVRSSHANLSAISLHQLTQDLRHFAYNCLCDTYIEAIKPRLKEGRQAALVPLCVLHQCLETSFKLMHPIMPFITEELYQRIRHQIGVSPVSIMNQMYPCPDEWSRFEDREADQAMIRALDLVARLRRLKLLYDIKRAHRPEVCLVPQQWEKQHPHWPDLLSTLVPCGQVATQESWQQPEQTWAGWHSPDQQVHFWMDVRPWIDSESIKASLNQKKDQAIKDIAALQRRLEEDSRSGTSKLDEKRVELDLILYQNDFLTSL